MITDKMEAIKEMEKESIDFEQFDKSLLQDKDVALAYMQHHSSNNMLIKDFPIDIDVPGMVDDEEFVASLIQNLDVGYREEALRSLIKYSTFRIVEGMVDNGDRSNAEQLKQYATQLLSKYNQIVKMRISELSQKRMLLDDIDRFIEKAELDAFDNKSKTQLARGNYKNCNIGFTADIK